MTDKSPQKKKPRVPAVAKHVALASAGALAAGTGGQACVDAGDLKEQTRPNQAHAAGETSFNPERGTEGDGGMDSGDGLIHDVGVSAEMGEVLCFLSQEHEPGDISVHREAANEEDRTPVDFTLAEDGLCIHLPVEKGITRRMRVESQLMSDNDGLLRIEVMTEFDQVGFNLDFSLGSQVLVPVEEGQMP